MVAMEGCGAVVKGGGGGKQRDQSVGKGAMETTQIKEEGAGTRRGEQRDKTEMVTGHRPIPTPKTPTPQRSRTDAHLHSGTTAH